MYMRFHFTDISFKLLRHRNENTLSCSSLTCLCSEPTAKQYFVLSYLWFLVCGTVGFLVMVCLGFCPSPSLPHCKWIFSSNSAQRWQAVQSQCLEGTGAALGAGFRNRARIFLVYTLEESTENNSEIHVYVQVCTKVAWVAKGRSHKWERKVLKHFWSSLFKWVKGKLEVLVAF